MEATLVYDLAKFRWLTDRAIRFQQNLFLDNGSIDTTALPVLIRYQNTNHRAFLATLKSLQTIQNERKKREREFVSSTYDPDSPYFIERPSTLLFCDENGVPAACYRPPEPPVDPLSPAQNLQLEKKYD